MLEIQSDLTHFIHGACDLKVKWCTRALPLISVDRIYCANACANAPKKTDMIMYITEDTFDISLKLQPVLFMR